MMNYDLKKMYDWPLIPRAILIGIVGLIVIYLGYLFDLSSVDTHLAAAQLQEQDLKNQFITLTHNIVDIKTELKKYPILESILTQSKSKMISPKDLPELLNQILKMGSQNELEFINFTPGIEEKDGGYSKVAIKSVMIGTYDQIANFMSQIANMEQIVVVGNLVISKTNPDKTAPEQIALGNRLTASLTLEIYEAKTS
jgi:type IV pilus assembly protein PilO